MNIAAYCRVSTEKEDQLNSLEAQKKFFLDYAERTGGKLIKLYADEGLSGTKTKNRKQFLQMMADARLGLFDAVIVKDISRFARNTVDLLQNIRELRALGIETQFLTANMTNIGSSEFILTVFGALAQEESFNTSKRVKFGKKINAEKGRVPNLVFGYNKTPGDYFTLSVNEKEANAVRQIFSWYIDEGFGATKISKMLNARHIKTKRGCSFTQNAVCRILENEIYTGKIINGKEEVADFLTGKRAVKSREDWLVTNRPELKIISEEDFEKARKLKEQRGQKFKSQGQRHSNQYLFSSLIRCKNCGRSFKRLVRTYKNTYIKWVCSGHNGKGTESCCNAFYIDENELISKIEEYFIKILSEKEDYLKCFFKEYRSLYKKSAVDETAAQLKKRLIKLQKNRRKYIVMFEDDLITREELNAKTKACKKEAMEIKEKLEIAEKFESENLDYALKSRFKNAEDFCSLRLIGNAQLKQIIDRIEIDKSGNTEIIFRRF